MEKVNAVADRGYFNGEEIMACEQAGITVTLPKPRAATGRSTRMRGMAQGNPPSAPRGIMRNKEHSSRSPKNSEGTKKHACCADPEHCDENGRHPRTFGRSGPCGAEES